MSLAWGKETRGCFFLCWESPLSPNSTGTLEGCIYFLPWTSGLLPGRGFRKSLSDILQVRMAYGLHGTKLYHTTVIPTSQGCSHLGPQFSSVQFSRSVVSDSLRPRESQHTRPPCPSPTPGLHSDSRPSSQWCFSIIPSKEIPGLISLRMDWLDLLAVQGTLKILLQHHSSKASILRCSAFFTEHIKKQGHHSAYRSTYSQWYGFPNSHVWMWEVDHKEGWVLKNWCFLILVLEKMLESPLDNKEIQPVYSKGNQPWIFTGRTDAAAETSILWPPDEKNPLTGKDPDAGKDWGQEEKGVTEDEMVGWHHKLNGHEFEQTLGDSRWQRSLVYCSPWDCRVGQDLATEQQLPYQL